MPEDTNKETNQLNPERNSCDQEVETRLDQLSKRLDRLEALQEDEQRHWESLVQEIMKTRMSLRRAFKA